jgi:acyl carrier protein
MDVLETVKSILAEKIDISSLNEEDSLQDLGLDSLDLAETMIAIEEALEIEFTSEEIMKLATLKDVIELIQIKTK